MHILLSQKNVQNDEEKSISKNSQQTARRETGYWNIEKDEEKEEKEGHCVSNIDTNFAYGRETKPQVSHRQCISTRRVIILLLCTVHVHRTSDQILNTLWLLCYFSYVPESSKRKVKSRKTEGGGKHLSFAEQLRQRTSNNNSSKHSQCDANFASKMKNALKKNSKKKEKKSSVDLTSFLKKMQK